jgi:hypothetical protein
MFDGVDIVRSQPAAPRPASANTTRTPGFVTAGHLHISNAAIVHDNSPQQDGAFDFRGHRRLGISRLHLPNYDGECHTIARFVDLLLRQRRSADDGSRRAAVG